MDNASRALTIAGGVLIALMVISLFVFARGRWSSYENAKSEAKRNEQIVQFNKRFEAYDTVENGNKIVSLVNLAEEMNKKYGSENGYKDVVIYAKLINDENGHFPLMDDMSGNADYEEYAKKVSHSINGQKKYFYNMNKYIEFARDVKHAFIEGTIENDNDLFKEFNSGFRKLYFKCIDIVYDNANTMVCEMYFEQVEKAGNN